MFHQHLFWTLMMWPNVQVWLQMLPQTYAIPFVLPNCSQVCSTPASYSVLGSCSHQRPAALVKGFHCFCWSQFWKQARRPSNHTLPNLLFTVHPTIWAANNTDTKLYTYIVVWNNKCNQNAYISGQVSEEVYKAYKLELAAKNRVKNNIAHCCTKEALMYYTATWVHQPYIDSHVDLLVESLLQETGHRVWYYQWQKPMTNTNNKILAL
jgi:hypothetical protein